MLFQVQSNFARYHQGSLQVTTHVVTLLPLCCAVPSQTSWQASMMRVHLLMCSPARGRHVHSAPLTCTARAAGTRTRGVEVAMHFVGFEPMISYDTTIIIRGSVIIRKRRYHCVKTGIPYTNALSPYMLPQIHVCTIYNPIYYIYYLSFI